jgi:hypothetical protein
MDSLDSILGVVYKNIGTLVLVFVESRLATVHYEDRLVEVLSVTLRESAWVARVGAIPYPAWNLGSKELALAR